MMNSHHERGLLLGLIGRPGSGKDTAAQLLQADNFRCTAFAHALKIEAAGAYHIGPELLDHRGTKEIPLPVLACGNAANGEWLDYCISQGFDLTKPRSPRWVLQTWGEWRCSLFGADWWVRQVNAWIRYQRGSGWKRLVVTDVRKPLEAAAIRQAGGYLLRLHRPDTYTLAPDTAGHITEQIDNLPADADVHNDGDVHHLGNELARVIASLGAQRSAA